MSLGDRSELPGPGRWLAVSLWLALLVPLAVGAVDGSPAVASTAAAPPTAASNGNDFEAAPTGVSATDAERSSPRDGNAEPGGVGDATTPAARPLGSQQQRMRDCNARADVQAPKGAARRDFMRGCLSGGTVSVEFVGEDGLPTNGGELAPSAAETKRRRLAAATVPEDDAAAAARRAEFKRRLIPCVDASKERKLRGAERKAFMSECLRRAPLVPPGPVQD